MVVIFTTFDTPHAYNVLFLPLKRMAAYRATAKV